MYCISCGHEISAGARFCRSCGARQEDSEQASRPADSTARSDERVRAGPEPLVAGTRSSAAQWQTLSFDATRWSRGDLVTGVATLVLLIALFLPWFSVQFAGFSIPGLSVDALSAHGWMYITLLVTLAVIGYLVARAVYDDLRLPVPRWQALAGATGITLLLSVIAFADVPTGLGRSYGAFIGLLSTIAAVVGAVLVRSEERGAVVARVKEEATVKCSGCDRASPAGNRFCRSCGSKLMSGLSTPSR